MEGTRTPEPNPDIDWDQAFLTYIELISCGTEASKLRATAKLALLCHRAPDHILVPTVRILVDLLDDPSAELQQAAVCALRRVAQRGDGTLRPLIGQVGALPALVRMLRRGGCGVRRVVVGCIRDAVECDKSNQMSFARSGGLKAVLEALPLATGGMRRELLDVISMLGTLKEVRHRMVALGGLPYLVEAVSQGRMATRARAAHAVGFLGTTRRNRHRLVNAGVVPVLVELLRDGDMQTKLTVANSLGIISSSVDFLRLVAEAGAIPLYAELLQGPDPLGREIAEDVFCLLAVIEENAVSISRHLVRILREGSEEGKAAAADVLWDLASYKYSSSVISDSGAIQLLIEILRDGDGDVRERVSGAITQLSYEEIDRSTLADAGAIPILIGLINDDSDELKENAAEALINFSVDPSFQERVTEVLNEPVFCAVKDRLFRSGASDGYADSSLRQIADELMSDHDLG